MGLTQSGEICCSLKDLERVMWRFWEIRSLKQPELGLQIKAPNPSDSQVHAKTQKSPAGSPLLPELCGFYGVQQFPESTGGVVEEIQV